jgi:cytochrome b561
MMGVRFAMMRNSTRGYGLIAIFLHWVIAALFVGLLLVGIAMMRIENQRLAFDLIQWHKSLGFLTLGLVLLRLAWRLANIVPSLPTTLSKTEKITAATAHWLLYAFMLILPLTGWIMVSISVLEIPTFAFYLFIIPHLPLAISEAAEFFWIDAHAWLAYAAGALVTVHAAAALRHHFLLGDDVLRRMIVPVKARDADLPRM